MLGPKSLMNIYKLYYRGYAESAGMSYEATAGIVAFDEVNETSFRIGDYEALKEAAIDPYMMIRDAYLQNRKKQVKE